MSSQDSMDFILVASLEDLQRKGCIVVRGADRPIAVFYQDGRVYAVDNRCPHMGFPLHQGTVSDGILTCHWHHARFDLSSGCTFDLFADDVPAMPVEVRDGADGRAEVWVGSRPRAGDERQSGKRRLQEGMAQNISLIVAKSVAALQKAGVKPHDIVRDGALFGARHFNGWSSGMTILTALANLVPVLPEEEKFLALFKGLRHVANDCAGQAPRLARHPLGGTDASLETLKRWFRQWIQARHRDAAERTLLTAVDKGASPAQAADMMLSAATDRYYAAGGHALDAVNKAFELLDLIGWEHARDILPAVVPNLVAATGGEEQSAWRHPVDLVPILERAFEQLPAWFETGVGKTWDDEAGLAHQLLGDEPAHITDALGDAIRAGAQPEQLSKALCYAAAMRIARFGTANEFGDWITALHTFTYCNALHGGIRRVSQLHEGEAARRDVARGIFHGAMSVYLDRFLNVPPAVLPGEREPLDETTTDAKQLCACYLDALDAQQQVDKGAQVVARYLALGHPLEPLIATLARGVLREDADFHTFQMLEAAVRQYDEWHDTPQGTHILLALARYLAAHSPTQRQQLQTAQIALRLHRGEALYEEAA